MFKKISGVYKITNLVSNKIYVGSAVDINRRWRQHNSDLNLKKHANVHLQRSWGKYGYGVFKFEIIELCEKDKLLEREQYYINTLDVYKNGYNRTPTAGSSFGVKRSEEVKKRISNTLKGIKLSEETKRKMSVARKGVKIKPWSEEARKKISEARKGKPSNRKGVLTTKETKKKISDANKGKKAWNKGKSHSEETKFKLKKAWEKRRIKMVSDG